TPSSTARSKLAMVLPGTSASAPLCPTRRNRRFTRAKRNAARWIAVASARASERGDQKANRRAAVGRGRCGGDSRDLRRGAVLRSAHAGGGGAGDRRA